VGGFGSDTALVVKHKETGGRTLGQEEEEMVLLLRSMTGNKDETDTSREEAPSGIENVRRRCWWLGWLVGVGTHNQTKQSNQSTERQKTLETNKSIHNTSLT